MSFSSMFDVTGWVTPYRPAARADLIAALPMQPRPTDKRMNSDNRERKSATRRGRSTPAAASRRFPSVVAMRAANTVGLFEHIGR